MALRLCRRWSPLENSILEQVVDANRAKLSGKREELAVIILEKLREVASSDDRPLALDNVRTKLGHHAKRLRREAQSSQRTTRSSGRVDRLPSGRKKPKVDSAATRSANRARQKAEVVIPRHSSTASGRNMKQHHPPRLSPPGYQHPVPRLPVREVQGPRQERARETNTQTLSRATPDQTPRGSTITASEGEASGSSTMVVEAWERKFVEIMRNLKAHESYTAPPRHSHVRSALSNTMLQIEHSIKCYLQAHPCSYLDLNNATQEAYDLCQVSFAPSNASEVVDKLETASSHPALSLDILLQVLASNAVFTWVFNGFKENPQSQMPFAVERTFNRFAQHCPEAVRRLNIATKLDLLDTTVRPRLPLDAIEFQVRLFKVFKSMRVPPVEREPAHGAGGPPDYSLEKHREFKKTMTTVFFDMLKLRADLSKSNRQYVAQFFEQDEPFDEERMEPHRQDRGHVLPNSRVYICLRPAILSFARESASEAPRPSPGVVVVKAKVVISSGYAGQSPSL